MTKVEAIKKILEANNGIADLNTIYTEIDKYYVNLVKGKDWTAGIRGVLYREINEKRNFKKIGFSLYALEDYKEEKIHTIKKDKVRMHSFMEGICLDIGNFLNLKTYTADPSAMYNNIPLSKLAGLRSVPEFTYKEIIETIKNIDIIWFNPNGFKYPKKAIEVVDSIGTLEPALKRTFQLSEFNLSFYILCKNSDKPKVLKAIEREPYIRLKNRYIVKDYESILEIYQNPFLHQDDDLFKINSLF